MPPKQKKTGSAGNATSNGVVDNPMSIDTVAQLQALAHPLRMRLLDKFAVKPMTTKQISTELGMQATRLYHHVSKLEDAGLIALVKTRQVRGTTEKYYSSVATNLRIDRSAFDFESSKLVGEIIELGVLDSLFDNVKCEVRDYLSRRSADSNAVAHEIFFATAEVAMDEASIPDFRARLARLIDEFRVDEDRGGGVAEGRKTCRLLIGCYPTNTE